MTPSAHRTLTSDLHPEMPDSEREHINPTTTHAPILSIFSYDEKDMKGGFSADTISPVQEPAAHQTRVKAEQPQAEF